jgi:transposase
VTMLAEAVEIVIGVDTHKHTHTAAVVAARGGAAVETVTVATTPDGYAQLAGLAERHSGRRAWAIEGTGSYGAGLARFLADRSEFVIELDRPDRPARRNGAKSDPHDAERAAREALARKRLAQPRRGTDRAALSVRLAARRSAIDAAGIAQRQLHALVTAAPEQLRAKFRGQTSTRMLATATRLRPHTHTDTELASTATVLRELARRARTLQSEARDHEAAIRAIVTAWRPDLLELYGVGPICAAVVLCAWSHPGRCRNDGAFATLAGTAPLPASSGQTIRHRLNRHGDRQLNRALHTIALQRLRHDPTTRTYAQRRRHEGKTDREIRRCLTRYIARQLYRQLEHHPLDAP